MTTEEAAVEIEITDEDFAARMFAKFAERATEVADRLRELADAVERSAQVGQSLDDLQPDHADAAARVVHTVTWGVANIGLDRLVERAAVADRAARAARQ